MKNRRDIRALDLFCGCGGLSTGLAAAGWEIVAGVDRHEDELLTWHAAHIGAFPLLLDLINGEGAAETVAALARSLGVNAVVGGPPCQDFSVSGKGEGQAGQRNGFPVFLEIVELVQPEIVLFENVPGLVQQHTDYFQSILDRLAEFGYKLTQFRLNSADYGVPQTRKRIFVIGMRNTVFQVALPAPTHSVNGDGLPPWRGWGEVIDWTLPIDRPATQIVRKHIGRWIERHGTADMFLARQARPNSRAPMVRAINKPALTVQSVGEGGGRADLVLVRQLQGSAGGCQIRSAEQPSLTVDSAKGSNTLVLVQQLGHPTGEACRVRSADVPSATVLSGGEDGGRADLVMVRLDGLRQRHLTLTELAALQGFPAGYPFSGNKTAVRRQIGNAVPPPMAKAVGWAIEKFIVYSATAPEIEKGSEV